MKKSEILQHAARLLGDESVDFISSVIKPNFDLVLGDLARMDAVSALRKRATFKVETGRRFYDAREITDCTRSVPTMVESLTVYAWGSAGKIERAENADVMRDFRIGCGEDLTGRWLRWCNSLNPIEIEVCPPASSDEDGATCEVVFVVPPAALEDDAEVLDIQLEDVPVVVQGLRFYAAGFKEETAGDKSEAYQLFDAGARRMWGRRFNSRVGTPQPFEF